MSVSQHPTSKTSFFFLGKKEKKKGKLLILLPLGIYVEWLRKFSFSSRLSYFRKDWRRVEIEMIEYCVNWLFAGIFVGIPQIHSNCISWAGSYDICGCFFLSLDNIFQFANSLFDGVPFPECHAVFVSLENNFIARKEMFFFYGARRFLKLCFPWNEFIEDGLDFSYEHCFCRRASHGCVRIRGYPIHLQKLL